MRGKGINRNELRIETQQSGFSKSVILWEKKKFDLVVLVLHLVEKKRFSEGAEM